MSVKTSGAATLSRRSWLQGSALLALYAWAANGARAAPPQISDLRAADTLLIDAQLPEAATLKLRASAVTRVEILKDDVGELFYGRLLPGWRTDGLRSLMGLTRAPALFLLEPLTAEYGLRIVEIAPAAAAPFTQIQNLCAAPSKRRRPANLDLLHAALHDSDAAFAWYMSPVHRSTRSDVKVIPL